MTDIHDLKGDKHDLLDIQLTLEELNILLNSWGISTNEWIFIAHYASKILGYDVSVREGHLSLIMDREKIPWKVTEGLEIHPPNGSNFLKQYKAFVSKTGYVFDIEPYTHDEFIKKHSDFVFYPLKSGVKIQIQTPIGAIEGLNRMISNCTDEGWGYEKIIKVKAFIEDGINAFMVKNEVENAEKYKQLLSSKDFTDKYNYYLARKNINTDIEINKLLGFCASPGTAIGKVMLVLNPENAVSISEDTILVTTMTSPNLTLSMKKVKAIVTDLGGQLCHAAILARELNIPCVVGTKTATKIFKDGDIVEVDANKGFVKKI